MHRLSRYSSELTEVRCWCRRSRNYRPLLLLPLAAAAAAAAAAASRGTVCWLLQLVWVPLVASSKHQNRLLYTDPACRLGKYYCCGGDQLARLVHRGVCGSPRMMVQHARAVVGASNYYHGTTSVYDSIAAALLVVRDRVVRHSMTADDHCFFSCRVCLTNHGRDSRLAETYTDR